MLNRKVFIASVLAALTTSSAFGLVAFAETPAGTATMLAGGIAVQGNVAGFDQDKTVVEAARNADGGAAVPASDDSAVKVDMAALESAVAKLIDASR